jgi:hypothetical protein
MYFSFYNTCHGCFILGYGLGFLIQENIPAFQCLVHGYWEVQLSSERINAYAECITYRRGYLHTLVTFSTRPYGSSNNKGAVLVN